METISVPRTALTVSRIGLGTWAIGGTFWGGSDGERSVATVLAALDAGINLIDTAPVYGYGVAEEIVGRALRAYRRRDQVVIATKAGLAWDNGRIVRDSRPERLEQELHDSLRRLRVDTIDVYQVHWPDPQVPMEAVAETMARFLQAGKIRAIGVSNFNVAQLQAFQAIAPLHTVQPPFNLFEQAAVRDVLPYAASHGLTPLLYGSLCRGLLSGRIGSGTEFSGDDIRQVDPKFQDRRLAQYLTAVARLDRLASSRYNRRVIHLAVRWVLDRVPGSVALWGARKPEQLDPLPDIMNWHLEPGDLEAADQIVKEAVSDPVGPEFMAPQARNHKPIA